MGTESEGVIPPELECMSIHEKARACKEMFWNLQTAILGMQAPIEWASHVLSETDLCMVATNMQALQAQLDQIETYSNALQAVINLNCVNSQ